MSAALPVVGGWIREDPKPTDRPFARVRSALIAKAISPFGSTEHRIERKRPIKSQHPEQSCAACATNAAVEIAADLAGVELAEVSVNFTFYQSRLYDGLENDASQGTTIRGCFDSLRDVGAPPTSAWVYDPARVTERPALSAYEAGYKLRIDAAYRIGSLGRSRLDDVEIAVRANHPVVFGTLVGQEFIEYGGDARAFNAPSNPEGGHALLVVGIRPTNSGNLFLVQNSWGPGWGDQGLAWATENWIADGFSSDFWVSTLSGLESFVTTP